ncbi:MAG: hypothetical protein LBV23_03920 [Deltaproteobacteria bacterium]|jgi:hypothetical protein|nr:hypothetical protein [Deltaproteobacteria bacterium]
MLVLSEFLGLLNRMKEFEKKNNPLVKATFESSPGDNDKTQPQAPAPKERLDRAQSGEVEYLNQKSSTVSVIL